MRAWTTTLAVSLFIAMMAGQNSICQHSPVTPANLANANGLESMSEEKLQFGNFSVSLAVKDLSVSREFYEKLDFEQVGGEEKHNYLIMQNGTTTIGLFQGMFEDNILTFNPGWNHKAESLEEFQDVRDLQATLKERGIEFSTEADAESSGPASFVLVDPDGNPILVDQHIPKPKK